MEEHDYDVELPIIGKAFRTVTAASQEDAIQKAAQEVTSDDFEDWHVDELRASASRSDGTEEEAYDPFTVYIEAAG